MDVHKREEHGQMEQSFKVKSKIVPKNSMAFNGRPPLVGEVNSNFCG
jgi:hypothetical protein